ncbi:hypothetical protein LTR28_001489, partial [Elasticomyces elasticus]
GAHGATQGGIYGLPGKGAFSIVLAGGTHYQDRDLGDRIAYCGTDSENGEITPHTQRMMESVNKHPVRVIRSHTLSSEYAPIEGFRYDGLYDVVGFSLVDQSKQTHVFEMVRQEGQDPIRSRELGLAARPTQQEIAAVVNDKKLRGYRDRDKVSKRENHAEGLILIFCAATTVYIDVKLEPQVVHGRKGESPRRSDVLGIGGGHGGLIQHIGGLQAAETVDGGWAEM